jgi:hypothetical protein
VDASLQNLCEPSADKMALISREQCGLADT